jgi:AraC-like DNA-binding protein
MKFEFVNIIHIIIVWQSLLFAILLITPKYNKKTGNKFLALMLLTFGVHFIYNILFTNRIFLDFLPAYSCSYGYLYGPLLYFYVKFHLQKDAVFKPLYWLHFLPFTITIILTAFGFKICNIIGVWLLPVMLVYCFFGFTEISHYKKVIRQVSSNNINVETKWLKTLLLITVIIVILDILQSQLIQVSIFAIEIPLEPVVQIGVLILVNTITYQGLKNPCFFQQITSTDVAVSKINKSSIYNKEVLNSLSFKLEEYMKQNKPYLNNDIDLTILAETLKVHPKILSQSINLILGYNFSDYINSYRVEEAKLLLKNHTDEQITIMEIMYDVGFNSRSVFNTFFKKKTGLTPSQYRALDIN